MGSLREPYTEEQEQWIRDYFATAEHPSKLADAYNAVFEHKRTNGALYRRARLLGLANTRVRNYDNKPIGSEFTNCRGQVFIKVKYERGKYNWKLKSHYLWEQAYGKIPKGNVIIFLNNDMSDVRLENLACVKNATLTSLKNKGWKSNIPEITKVGVLWMELYDTLEPRDAKEIDYRDDTLFVKNRVKKVMYRKEHK